MFVGYFCLDLGPDCESVSGYGSRNPIESGSNPDPDPQHWLQELKNPFVRFIFRFLRIWKKAQAENYLFLNLN